MVIDKSIAHASYFIVDDKTSLANLHALLEFLKIVDASTFEHHVTRNHNHFADWVQHVFGEEQLANDLRSCTTAQQMHTVLTQALGLGSPGAENRTENQESAVIARNDTKPDINSLVQESGNAANSVAPMDDAAFNEVKGPIITKNELLGNKYDEIVRRMQEALTEPFPKVLELLTDKLKGRYEDLRVQVADARKRGKDALIPALVLRQFPAKLALARATREPKDFDYAALVLDSAAFELKEVLDAKEVNVKDEVLALAKEGTITNEAALHDGR